MIPYLYTFYRNRYGSGICTHVNGYDDAATYNDIAAV